MILKIEKHKNIWGFTLVEFMVTVGIGSIIFLAVASLSLYTGRSFAGISNYLELDRESRNALDTITRDIRQVNFLDSFTTNRLIFEDSDRKPLIFHYDPNNKVFYKVKDGVTNVLLRGCDELVIRIYQRNPVPGSYDLIPTTNAVLCKAVDISWVCTRKVLNGLINTESIQTARVVIRKQKDLSL
jgi:Tfp pilus assembly protein PilW